MDLGLFLGIVVCTYIYWKKHKKFEQIFLPLMYYDFCSVRFFIKKFISKSIAF